MKSKAKASPLKWHFPPTGGGISYGLVDSGQEFFRNNAWEQTIREIIQNSLDAADDRKSGPVSVNISEIMVPASEIGAADLARHMLMVVDEAKKDKSRDGEKFYKDAIRMLGQNEIRVLAITDTNTTGLVDKKWDTLIHTEGTSLKEGMGAAGGNFGIGKNAPYVVSALKTVCYSTRYLSAGRTEKFISRCKIASHKNPDDPDEMLQHVGFGTKSKFKKKVATPATIGSQIYDKFRLKQQGSGIFIMGFEPRLRNWVRVAKKSIAHNFFMAIHEKKLKILIGSDQINHETLDTIFEDGDIKEHTRHYYHIIRDKNSIGYDIDGKFGKFRLMLKTDDEDLPNHVAYVNRKGMFITDARSFKRNPFYEKIGSGWAKYAAVIVAGDDRTDMEIRKMEPPNHKTIEYERTRDSRERREVEDKLREIRSRVSYLITQELNKNNNDRSVNLSELADILPFPSDSGKGEIMNGGLEDGGLLDIRVIDPAPATDEIKNEPGADDPGEEGGEQGGKGAGDSSDDAVGDVHRHTRRSSMLTKPRVVRGKDTLRVAFTPSKSSRKKICLAIMPAGEERKNEASIPLNQNQVRSSSDAVEIRNNLMYMTPKQGRRVVIDLEMRQTERYTGYEIQVVVPNRSPGTGKK